MKHELQISYQCRNCGDEIDIYNDDKLITPIGEDCTFCRNGCYNVLTIYLDSKEIFKKVF